MKIIKYGEGYPQQVCCAKCKSILEIEPGDLYQDKLFPKVAGSIVEQVINTYIICPVCSEVNMLRETLFKY